MPKAPPTYRRIRRRYPSFAVKTRAKAAMRKRGAIKEEKKPRTLEAVDNPESVICLPNRERIIPTWASAKKNHPNTLKWR
jgi:hypothetical protein